MISILLITLIVLGLLSQLEEHQFKRRVCSHCYKKYWNAFWESTKDFEDDGYSL